MTPIEGIRFGFGTRKEPIPTFIQQPDWEKRPRWKQVHGIDIMRITSHSQECGEVDGLWSETPSLPVSVVTADCLPLLFFHKDKTVVAALHAGWKGTLARIPEAFFKTLPAPFNVPSEWSALIGPSIRACCYEVSPQLIQDFSEKFPEISKTTLEPKPRKLDLVAVTLSVLKNLGVNIALLHPECTLCTREDGVLKYLSYRGGDRASRQYSVIQTLPLLSP